MSACMSGTRGSGVLSSTGDVLVRGVGGVCDMCMCLARGGVGGEWMRELSLDKYPSPLLPFAKQNHTQHNSAKIST